MTTTVRIETDFGAILVDLNADDAPITSTNFLHYVDDGIYDGGIFHRTVRPENVSNTNLKLTDADDEGIQLPNDRIMIEVIQASNNPNRDDDLDGPIPLERTSETGLSHVDGTISMARFAPDSAVSDFFICIGDQPELDFGGKRNPDGQGFAAFGRVTQGMEIVRTIQQQPARGQTLDPEVRIIRIVRV